MFKKTRMTKVEKAEKTAVEAMSAPLMMDGTVLPLRVIGENVYENLADSEATPISVILGSCGSGKSRYYVRPNILLENPHKTYLYYGVEDEAMDLIKELSDESKAKALVYTPFKVKYNPLAFLNSKNYTPQQLITQITTIANIMLKDSKDNNKGYDPFWDISIETLLKGLIAVDIVTSEDDKKYIANFKSISAKLDEIIADSSKDSKCTLDSLIAQTISYKGSSIEDVATYAADCLNVFKMNPSKTAGAIVTALKVIIMPFTVDNCQENEFDLAHITARQFRYTFVGVTPTLVPGERALASMFLLQYLTFFSQEDTFLHVILDEAASLYPETITHIIENGLIYLKDKRIHFDFIYQVINQITYSKAVESHLLNSNTTYIYMGTSDTYTLEFVTEIANMPRKIEDIRNHKTYKPMYTLKDIENISADTVVYITSDKVFTKFIKKYGIKED